MYLEIRINNQLIRIPNDFLREHLAKENPEDNIPDQNNLNDKNCANCEESFVKRRGSKSLKRYSLKAAGQENSSLRRKGNWVCYDCYLKFIRKGKKEPAKSQTSKDETHELSVESTASDHTYVVTEQNLACEEKEQIQVIETTSQWKNKVIAAVARSKYATAFKLLFERKNRFVQENLKKQLKKALAKEKLAVKSSKKPMLFKEKFTPTNLNDFSWKTAIHQICTLMPLTTAVVYALMPQSSKISKNVVVGPRKSKKYVV